LLIQFRTENHRSLRDEQVLSLTAATHLQDESSSIHVEGLDEALLPVVAIYGANASGKTNVLLALLFMGTAVVSSARQWDPKGGVPRSPFALNEAAGDAPSLYEADLLVEGVRMRYGFVVDDDMVLEEWLYAWPHGRRQLWFSREGGEFEFGREFKGHNKSIAEMTRPNALFLSAAAQMNHAQLMPLVGRFIVPAGLIAEAVPEHERDIGFAASFFRPLGEDQEDQSEADQRRREAVLSLLRAADLGIKDFVVVDPEEAVGGKVSAGGRSVLALRHRSIDPDGHFLPLELESGGTRKLVSLIPLLVTSLQLGYPMLLDELESSMHPLLAAEIIRIFQDPLLNPNHAQLILTTHDSTLLGNALGDPLLRRDQVWLTEKDSSGATTLYPLTDFHPRKTENLERGYLQGRYGGVPIPGSFAITPVDEVVPE